MEQFGYTPKEAMAYLGVSRGTLYRLIRSKQIPAVRVGGQLRIPRSKLNEQLDQRLKEPLNLKRRGEADLTLPTSKRKAKKVIQ